MRMRCITFRVTDDEHKTLKAEADKIGASVPLYARWKALNSIPIEARYDELTRLIRDIPERKVIAEAFTRIAARIDRAGGKGGAS